MKITRDKKQRIPRWGIFLFVILAAFAVARTLQRGVETAKTTQAPVRPVLVAKVISKDVPIYLDEIGTCAAYETVQVQAQVSGKILARRMPLVANAFDQPRREVRNRIFSAAP